MVSEAAATDDAAPVEQASIAAPARLGPLELAAAGSLALVAIVGSAAAFAQGWVPVSDAALIALHVADVPSNLPLVGAWSRLGWSHPGPAQYYLLSVPYRLSGADTAGLMVGTLLLGTLGTALAWLVARRRDLLAGALVFAALMAVMAGREAVDLRDPWNPYVGIVLTGTLVVVGWAAADRRRVGAFCLLPLGSLLVQAHVGYLPVVASVVASAALLGALRPAAGRASTRWAWLWGAAVAAAMWLPPLYQQFTADEGNLGLLFESGAGEGPLAGAGPALRTLFAAFALPPSWLGRDLPVGSGGVEPPWTVPLLMVVPLAAAVLAARRRCWSETTAVLVSLAALAGTTVGVASIRGTFHDYLFSGLGAVAAVSIALGAWVLLRSVGSSPRVLFAGAAVALLLGTGAGLLVAIRQLDVAGPYESTAEAVGELAPLVVSDARGEEAFVEAVPEFTAFAALPGFVLALEEAGIDVAVPEGSEREFGAHRVGEPAGRTRYLVALPGMVDALEARGWKLVGTHDPLPGPASERAAELDEEFLTLQEELRAAIEAGEDTARVNRQIDANRQESYEVRAERFPLAVMRRR